MDTGRITDEESIYIETRIVETVTPLWVARRLFPRWMLPNPGIMTMRGYKRTDMSAARVSLYGSQGSKDRTEKAPFDLPVVVIDKEFEIAWRELAASRGLGVPLDTQEAENAARRVQETEELLLITGECTGKPMCGVEGLATATGRNTVSGGDWSANAVTYVNNAIAELEADKHYGPYGLVIRPSWWRQLTASYLTSTAVSLAKLIEELCTAGVFRTDSLYTSAGATTNALVVEPSAENFDLGFAEDIHPASPVFDVHGNMDGLVREVLGPRIKRPTSICEITGLT